MAAKAFQPFKDKQEVLEALRGGMTPEECAVKWPISLRTAYRYQKELEGQPGHNNVEQSTCCPTTPRSGTMKITIELGLPELNAFLDFFRMTARLQVEAKHRESDTMADLATRLMTDVATAMNAAKKEKNHGD